MHCRIGRLAANLAKGRRRQIERKALSATLVGVEFASDPQVCAQVWNVYSVMKYLEALIAKSNIHETLINEAKGTVAAATADGAPDLGQLNLFKMLGYFSMIGLLRMHCLLGDYYLALKVQSCSQEIAYSSNQCILFMGLDSPD